MLRHNKKTPTMQSIAGAALNKSGRLDLNQRPLLPKQVNTLTNYYILPDFRGKPGVGAGVSRRPVS